MSEQTTNPPADNPAKPPFTGKLVAGNPPAGPSADTGDVAQVPEAAPVETVTVSVPDGLAHYYAPGLPHVLVAPEGGTVDVPAYHVDVFLRHVKGAQIVDAEASS